MPGLADYISNFGSNFGRGLDVLASQPSALAAAGQLYNATGQNFRAGLGLGQTPEETAQGLQAMGMGPRTALALGGGANAVADMLNPLAYVGGAAAGPLVGKVLPNMREFLASEGGEAIPQAVSGPQASIAANRLTRLTGGPRPPTGFWQNALQGGNEAELLRGRNLVTDIQPLPTGGGFIGQPAPGTPPSAYQRIVQNVGQDATDLAARYSGGTLRGLNGPTPNFRNVDTGLTLAADPGTLPHEGFHAVVGRAQQLAAQGMPEAANYLKPGARLVYELEKYPLTQPLGILGNEVGAHARGAAALARAGGAGPITSRLAGLKGGVDFLMRGSDFYGLEQFPQTLMNYAGQAYAPGAGAAAGRLYMTDLPALGRGALAVPGAYFLGQELGNRINTIGQNP